MKSREPFHEIGDLLRSHKPDPRPSSGLEMRILRSLSPREPSRRLWPWFLLPPAVALGILLLWPDLSPPSAAVTLDDPAPPPPVENEAPLIFPANPLEREALALRRDAGRAGRFLIDCLPSLGGIE